MTIALVALVVALPVMASAKDMTGMMGLGFNLTDAPIGIRYWFSPQMGLDVGIGYESKDLGNENASNFFVEAGLPYVVYGTDHANLYLRVGAGLGILDDRTVPGSLNIDDTRTQLDVTIGPGVEVFWGDHFSLQASHGIGFTYTQLPSQYKDFPATGQGEDTLLDFATFGNSVTELGFHFYF
jgi:hypothetical protein